MGQEKSLPDRCNSAQYYQAPSTVSRSPSYTPSSSSTATKASKTSKASYTSIESQTNYLKHQLYIKSYLDIADQDRHARDLFRPAARPGLRNYTPKILEEQPPPKQLDIWI